MKEYTSWRQFLAWSGAVAWIILIALFMQFHRQMYEVTHNPGIYVWKTMDNYHFFYAKTGRCVDYGEGITCE